MDPCAARRRRADLRYGWKNVQPPGRGAPGPGVRAAYSARYRDARGEEHTVVEEYTDPARGGSRLRLVVRGVAFEGWNLASLAPTRAADDERRDLFAFSRWGLLAGYALECHVPVRVVASDDPVGRATAEVVDLQVFVEVGPPGSEGATDTGALQFTLTVGAPARVHTSPDDAVLAPDEQLAALSASLPGGTRIEVCATCGLSDANPAGGPLACFRGNKAAYREVRGKSDLFRIWHTRTEYVQDYFVCPEYEPRITGTGYRG